MSVGVTMSTTSSSMYDVVRRLLNEAEALDNEAAALYERSAVLHSQAEGKRAEAANLNQKAQGVISGEYDVSEILREMELRDAQDTDVTTGSSPVSIVENESVGAVPTDESVPAIIEDLKDVPAEAVIVEEEEYASAGSPAVEVELEEMTDEHADMLPFGNDLPRPSLPIKTHEVAQLHIPFLDQIDGSRFTPDEVERFCTARFKRGSDVVDRYMCVCCTTDEENPVDYVSHDIKWFAGVTVCVEHSHKILKWLNQAQVRTRFMLRGEEADGYPKAHWLHGAFKHLSKNPFSGHDAYDAMRDANLKREVEILAKLRSAKSAPEEKVDVAVRTGEVVDLPHDSRFDDVEDSSPDLPASFKGSAPRVLGSRISEHVEFFAAEGDDGVPHPSQDELDSAASEHDFLQMLFPLWGFRKRLKRSLVDERLCKESDAYQSATHAISRIHRVWESRNPSSHEFWRKKMTLRTLKLKKSLTDQELAERAELEKDKKLSAEVNQMISNMRKQRSDEDEAPEVDPKKESARAKSIRRKAKDRRNAEDTAWLAKYDAKIEAAAAAATAKVQKEAARKARQVERAKATQDRKGAKRG